MTFPINNGFFNRFYYIRIGCSPYPRLKSRECGSRFFKEVCAEVDTIILGVDPLGLIDGELVYNKEKDRYIKLLKVQPYKNYLVMKVESDNKGENVTNIEYAEALYRGKTGLNKDVKNAVSYLMKDGSPKANLYLANIFMDEPSMENQIMADKYIQLACEKSLGDAIVTDLFLHYTKDSKPVFLNDIEDIDEDKSSFVKAFFSEAVDPEISFDIYNAMLSKNSKLCVIRMKPYLEQVDGTYRINKEKFIKNYAMDGFKELAAAYLFLKGFGFEKNKTIATKLLRISASYNNIIALKTLAFGMQKGLLSKLSETERLSICSEIINSNLENARDLIMFMEDNIKDKKSATNAELFKSAVRNASQIYKDEEKFITLLEDKQKKIHDDKMMSNSNKEDVQQKQSKYVFISYSSKNQQIADSVRNLLKKMG